jgi:tRNA threonylcarbamoyladenosine biosynthesis protein TsaE
MTISYQLDELKSVAKQLIQEIAAPIWLFYGEMGAGKTTLIREILLELGVSDNVQSPTFSLVNEYVDAKNKRIFHFDFYRIEDEEEAYDMGIEDYFYSDSRCLVEWPEKIPNLIPENSVEIHISINKDYSRHLKIIQN